MFRLLLLPFRLLRSFVRLAGVRNSLLLLIGVIVGLLAAPTTGSELRARIAAKIEDRRSGADPAPYVVVSDGGVVD